MSLPFRAVRVSAARGTDAPEPGAVCTRERAWRDGQLYKMHLFCITACCDTIKVNFVPVRASVASDGSPRAVIAR